VRRPPVKWSEIVESLSNTSPDVTSMEHLWNDRTGENQRTRRKTSLGPSLSTTNPTWTDPGTNLGSRGERLVTNCLNHGTAGNSSVNLGEEI
jgi:hypothetical protein